MSVFQTRWPAGLTCAVAADPVFARDMLEIYNRYAEHPASVLLRLVDYLFSEDESLVLKPMKHVCYFWETDEEGAPDEKGYLVDIRFHDSGLLLELLVPRETVPLETVTWFDKPMTIPVFRKDEPLPEHPAAEWLMEIVRQLDVPLRFEVHAQLDKEIASEYIWGVCEELARGLATLAEVRGQAFPRPVDALQADLERLGARFHKMAASTGMTRLNCQAEIVCLAAQILLQTADPLDDLRAPWTRLLRCFGQTDPTIPMLAARAKVAFLVTHPELARLPNDSGLSLRGPMHLVGEAIRAALQRGVYQ